VEALDKAQAKNAANIEILTDVKADKTALDAKADKTALDVKADKTALDAKADKTALDAKADKTALNTKADKQVVEAEINNIKSANQQLSDRVTNNTASIAKNSARIDQLDKRVTKLDKKLERGLAQQAALSGLFQPYNVGKVNVTAAVGGYKSKTAVAVGAGYRFNDKVAAKAGVSFSTGGGSASYNVGVNYEF
ncbi:YadA C-terminal domain-containing protein, partial [Ursidibacter sp. B-7004-1]